MCATSIPPITGICVYGYYAVGLQMRGKPSGCGRGVYLGTQLNVWGQLSYGNAAAAALVLLVRLQRLLRQHQRGVVRHLLAESACAPGSR